MQLDPATGRALFTTRCIELCCQKCKDEGKSAGKHFHCHAVYSFSDGKADGKASALIVMLLTLVLSVGQSASTCSTWCQAGRYVMLETETRQGFLNLHFIHVVLTWSVLLAVGRKASKVKDNDAGSVRRPPVCIDFACVSN